MYHVTQAEIIALGLMTLGSLGLVWTKTCYQNTIKKP